MGEDASHNIKFIRRGVTDPDIERYRKTTDIIDTEIGENSQLANVIIIVVIEGKAVADDFGKATIDVEAIPTVRELRRGEVVE